MDAILAAIITSALTGITVFAYKHPKAYGTFFWVLIVVVSLAGLATNIWDSGNWAARDALIPYVRPEKMEEARRVVTETGFYVSIPFLWLFIIGFELFFFFLLFLPWSKMDGKSVTKASGSR